MNKIKLIIRRTHDGKWIAEKTDDGFRTEVSEQFANEMADQPGVAVLDENTEVKMKSKALVALSEKRKMKTEDNDIDPLPKQEIEPRANASEMQRKQFNYDNDPNSYPYEAPEAGRQTTVKIGSDGKPESEIEESEENGRKVSRFKNLRAKVK